MLVWRERVGWLVDLNQVVTHVAIETFLAELDGFLGGSGMANFYLYRPVATNVHRLLAWDRDTTFQDDRVADLRARRGERADQPRAAVQRSSRAVPRRARAVRARGGRGSVARNGDRIRRTS